MRGGAGRTRHQTRKKATAARADAGTAAVPFMHSPTLRPATSGSACATTSSASQPAICRAAAPVRGFALPPQPRPPMALQPRERRPRRRPRDRL